MFTKRNIHSAMCKVKANKGSPGIDGVTVDDLVTFRQTRLVSLREEVLEGQYRPKPIKRVYIPKDNGDKRPLGIPTVEDRIVQQVMATELSAWYERKFSDNSFGYRPKRSARGAVKRAMDIANRGKKWVIDLDLSKFFDTVNHSKLLQLLSDEIEDGRIISLIHRFLRAPICENGKVGKKTTIGTPQGGVISPILANVMLNELDQLLDSRGIEFVRYADDMVIFCNSELAAERILSNVTEFIEKKLFLKVNKEKTKIVRVGPQMQFLGFYLCSGRRIPHVIRKYRPRCQYYPAVVDKKLVKFKEKIKAVLDRRAPGGIKATKDRYNRIIRGAFNYYKGGLGVTWTEEFSSWARRRIRQLYWKQWKTRKNRCREFKKLNPDAPELHEYAYARNSYWLMSRTHQMHQALGNEALIKIGWLDLSNLKREHDEELRLKMTETALIRTRTSGGVRGG